MLARVAGRPVDRLTWIRTAAIFALLLGSLGQAEIIVSPEKAPVGTKVVAKVVAQIPEGATFDGGWAISSTGTGKAEAAKLDEPRTIGIWGTAGTYEIKYSGFWLLLKEVTFKDGDGNVVTIQSYLGHGMVNERATLVLEGENGPDPPPPPPPPVASWKIVLFYDSTTLDDMTRDQQAIMRGEAIKATLKQKGHNLLQRVEGHPTSYPPELREFIQAVAGKSLPRVALQSVNGGAVLDYPLPTTVEGFLNSLKDPKLKERLR